MKKASIPGMIKYTSFKDAFKKIGEECKIVHEKTVKQLLERVKPK